MVGLLKAAALLAPVLALVSLAAPIAGIVSTYKDIAASSSLITLGFDGISANSVLQELTLDLRISETSTPCGYGNVTIDWEPLIQDDLGIGSGPITTKSGTTLLADWKFTCLHLENDSPILSLSFHIVSVDGQIVQDAAFSVHFQQVAPISVLKVEGTWAKTESSPAARPLDNPRLSLEDELAELENLKGQLLMIEHAIALKIAYIADNFNISQPQELLQAADCGSLKCFFGAIYNRMKGIAGKLYHGGQGSTVSPGNIHALFPDGNESHEGQHPLQDMSHVEEPVSNSSPLEPGHFSNLVEVEPPTSTTDRGQPSRPLIGNGPHQVLRIVTLVTIFLTIAISVVIIIFMIRCVRLLHQRRRTRRDERRRRPRVPRDACTAPLVTKYMDLVQWLRDGRRYGNTQFQEKNTLGSQVNESDDETEDSLSVTMEEEIARFRAAADAVSNLITVDEGRGSRHPPEYITSTRPRRDSTPSSIISACPTYRSVDESLPAYDEHHSPDYIFDGHQDSSNSSMSRY
ncbi:hypothetical protein GGS21DRAFT_543291 [Xylaria nigripes]|nr:hypothetical protein GGS21DRAFT_543291 [Xylaria nigripes]